MSLTFSILRRFLIVTFLFSVQGPIINPVLCKHDGKNSSDDYSKIVDFLSRFAIRHTNISFFCRKVYVNFLPLNFVFSENGLVAHKDGKFIGTQEFINFTFHYIADLDIPIKRGTFIEFQSRLLNVSPIGQNCSQEERDEFERYDMVHNIHTKMVSVLRERFAHLNLTFSIGGQISFDGSDSTVCIYENICGYMYLYWFDTFSLFHFCLWVQLFPLSKHRSLDGGWHLCSTMNNYEPPPFSLDPFYCRNIFLRASLIRH
ncbi:hypothetical protein UlMin_042133 [Ulmus minor]